MKSDIADEIKNIFRFKDNLSILIFFNISVFVIISAINLVFFFTGKPFNFTEWIGVSSNFSTLIHRPWTIITYMFFHAGFIHIILNLLVLYWFGQLFLEYLSQRQLLGVYILGGLIGALFFVSAYNIIPIFATVKNEASAIGASASIMAVVFAIATLIPNLSVRVAFIAHVKLKYLALIIVLIDLLSIPLGNAGGHIAHLGGAFTGFIFAKFYAQGTDLTSFISFFENLFSRKSKSKRRHSGIRPESDANYNMRKAAEQKETDRILDKINKSGYSSLTTKEKESLFRNSKN